jgi:hypothetical protein
MFSTTKIIISNDRIVINSRKVEGSDYSLFYMLSWHLQGLRKITKIFNLARCLRAKM